MKNEKMLERCLEMAQHLDEEQKGLFDFYQEHPESEIYGLGGLLSELVREIKADIVSDGCKRAGRGNGLSAAKRILKSAMGRPHEFLHGAWMAEGKQCLSDSFHLVRLADPLPVDGIPEDAVPMDAAKIVSGAKDNAADELALPSVGELKAHIKIEKAARKGQRDRKPVGYDFGDGLPMVNAEYLLNMLELLPDCKAWNSRSKNGPIYFESEAGDGVLIPVRKG